MQTDSLIQRTLRTAPTFRGSTLIIIAHRIRTIIDADLVIVMEGGRVVEKGSPKDLVANTESVFRRMVQEAGVDIGSSA